MAKVSKSYQSYLRFIMKGPARARRSVCLAFGVLNRDLVKPYRGYQIDSMSKRIRDLTLQSCGVPAGKSHKDFDQWFQTFISFIHEHSYPTNMQDGESTSFERRYCMLFDECLRRIGMYESGGRSYDIEKGLEDMFIPLNRTELPDFQPVTYSDATVCTFTDYALNQLAGYDDPLDEHRLDDLVRLSSGVELRDLEPGLDWIGRYRMELPYSGDGVGKTDSGALRSVDYTVIIIGDADVALPPSGHELDCRRFRTSRGTYVSVYSYPLFGLGGRWKSESDEQKLEALDELVKGSDPDSTMFVLGQVWNQYLLQEIKFSLKDTIHVGTYFGKGPVPGWYRYLQELSSCARGESQRPELNHEDAFMEFMEKGCDTTIASDCIANVTGRSR